jgi:hypothetical protein
MSEKSHPYTVLFPPWFDEQFELETVAKGYLRDVEIRFDEGASYRLYFTDPVRLRQDAESEFEMGRIAFGEPGLVVIPEVTRANVLAAVEELFASKFFESFRPLPAGSNAIPSSNS